MRNEIEQDHSKRKDMYLKIFATIFIICILTSQLNGGLDLLGGYRQLDLSIKRNYDRCLIIANRVLEEEYESFGNRTNISDILACHMQTVAGRNWYLKVKLNDLSKIKGYKNAQISLYQTLSDEINVNEINIEP
jgi:hypothetical protein